MADVVVDLENTNPKELLGQGIRAYVLQDYNSAVNALSKATELLVKEHNDDCHDSLGDTYLYYGKALLALARDENEPLGSAIPKDEDSEESGEEENETAGENEEKSNENEEKKEDKSAENEQDKSAEDESKEGNNEGTSDQNEEEDPTDLQVAWEILELAKKIFEKRGDDGKKLLADTLVVLGEVSLESENFEAAVSDIKQGLDLQKELFGDANRTVAETCYKMGVAYSTASLIDEAVESFKESLTFLENRIKVLEKEDTEENKDEIKEIKGLIPDIEEKITDMKTCKEESIKKVLSALTETCNGSASSSKAATDISHLVKRKRKEDDKPEEVPAKKQSP